MARILCLVAPILVGIWLLLNLVAGWLVLPPMLLKGGLTRRSEAEREAIRAELRPPGCVWTPTAVSGGEDRPLEVWRLHRPGSRGVAVLLHGFGDDAWGAAHRLRDLPGLDAVAFTFRGRDRHPEVPSTLGGWERWDVVAVVERLVAAGVPRGRIVLVGASQGAGVALLALADLEARGGPLAGALLESPFASLEQAARDHLRGALGAAEWLLRPGEQLALLRIARLARFDPRRVSPLAAAAGLRTPVALLAGDRDETTPLPGVRAIAGPRGDLTVMAGAGHLEAGERLPGGWGHWAAVRLEAWGLGSMGPH